MSHKMVSVVAAVAVLGSAAVASTIAPPRITTAEHVPLSKADFDATFAAVEGPNFLAPGNAAVIREKLRQFGLKRDH